MARFALALLITISVLTAPPAYAAGDGLVTTDFAGADDFAEAVAVQADGKIVVAGRTRRSFALARYNPNGALDTGFGRGGKVITDFANSAAAGTAMAIQRDGRIVVVGRTGNTAGHSDFAVARYNVDGSLDTSFG